jgi:hypothetical protein
MTAPASELATCEAGGEALGQMTRHIFSTIAEELCEEDAHER